MPPSRQKIDLTFALSSAWIRRGCSILFTKEVRLAALKLCLEKFGDFLLELAVLVFVFVPLDIWQGKLSISRVVEIVCAAGSLFFIGLACHWVLFIIIEDQRKGAAR